MDKLNDNANISRESSEAAILNNIRSKKKLPLFTTISDTKVKKKLSLLCPYCFSIEGEIVQNIETSFSRTYLEDGEKLYAHSIIYMIDGNCVNCEQYVDEFIVVDHDIAPALSLLNKKGFKTVFSCAGHRDGDIAYIFFKSINISKYIIPGTLPKGWYVDVRDFENNKFIIRSKHNEYDPSELTAWAERLPYLYELKEVKKLTNKEIADYIVNSYKESTED